MFCPHCGKENNYSKTVFCPYCGQTIESSNNNSQIMVNAQFKRRNKATAVLLACLLGIFGAHKFYVGDKLLGFIYILFSWTLIPILFAIGDAILYTLSSEEVFKEKYLFVK